LRLAWRSRQLLLSRPSEAQAFVSALATWFGTYSLAAEAQPTVAQLFSRK